MKNKKLLVLGSGIFLLGFIAGDANGITRFKKKIRESQPLLTSTLNNIITKAMSGDLSMGELTEEINVELNFLSIITGNNRG